MRVSRIRSLLIPCGILIPVTAVALMLWMAANAASTIHYVTTTGNCGGETPCYASIQAAVDAANDGDEIRVAGGTYAGVQTQVANATG